MGLKVAFQGEPGAFSEEAVGHVFDDAETRPCTAFEDVFEAVEAGGAVTADFVLEPSTLVGNEVVITGTRQPEKVLDAPVTVEAISAENLDVSGGGTFLSALANLKGIYEIDAVQPVDMFPHTPHIETVVRLTLKDD